MSEERPTLLEQLTKAKVEIGAVGKGEKTTSGNIFSFRGVDGVVNAVAPVFNELGIVVTPKTLSRKSEFVTYGANNARGFRTEVEVAYIFRYGDEQIEASAFGEAIDAGDKSTAKAMSVAYRTCLLQSLNLPTQEKDPDHDQYDVSSSGGSGSAPAASEDSIAFIKSAIAEMDGFQTDQLADAWKDANIPPLARGLNEAQARVATRLVMTILDGMVPEAEPVRRGPPAEATQSRPSADSQPSSGGRGSLSSKVTEKQVGLIWGKFKDQGVTDHDEVHQKVTAMLQLDTDLESLNDLTKAQASKVIDQLLAVSS